MLGYYVLLPGAIYLRHHDSNIPAEGITACCNPTLEKVLMYQALATGKWKEPIVYSLFLVHVPFRLT
jgi:hypothetical protein